MFSIECVQEGQGVLCWHMFACEHHELQYAFVHVKIGCDTHLLHLNSAETKL